MRRDESVIGVKNEREGVVMSAHGAGSGFELVWWRWRRNRRWRRGIRWRSSRQNGISGDGVVAVASSLHFLFDFDFLVFFGHAGISVASGVSLRCGAMKLSARRRASLSPRAGASRANRVETLGEPVCVNSDELGMASLGKRKAVLPGVLGFEHLVDPFSIGRVVNVA